MASERLSLLLEVVVAAIKPEARCGLAVLENTIQLKQLLLYEAEPFRRSQMVVIQKSLACHEYISQQ